jgi:hypothetical protein
VTSLPKAVNLNEGFEKKMLRSQTTFQRKLYTPKYIQLIVLALSSIGERNSLRTSLFGICGEFIFTAHCAYPP